MVGDGSVVYGDDDGGGFVDAGGDDGCVGGDNDGGNDYGDNSGGDGGGVDGGGVDGGDDDVGGGDDGGVDNVGGGGGGMISLMVGDDAIDGDVVGDGGRGAKCLAVWVHAPLFLPNYPNCAKIYISQHRISLCLDTVSHYQQ